VCDSTDIGWLAREGASHAELITREGCKVVIGDLPDDAGRAKAAERHDGAREVSYVHLDVTHKREWDVAVAECRKLHGKPTVLVNRAAVNSLPPIENCAEAQSREISYGVFTRGGGAK
jgi:3alpha(or 20beta)-hydroxysteroid dehydrogenase